MDQMKKIKNARTNGFTSNEIVYLTMKIDSSLSNTNLCHFLILLIPKLHREFCGIVSQNPEYVKSVCTDRNNFLHFACRRWIIYWRNQSIKKRRYNQSNENICELLQCFFLDTKYANVCKFRNAIFDKILYKHNLLYFTKTFTSKSE